MCFLAFGPLLFRAPAPVIFYVHGSLFVAGDAWTHGAFSGEVLAQLFNVLIVGAQYRLGIFGFLALQELQEEAAPTRHTGNYGLLDEQGALKWVDDNGMAFGGSKSLLIWGGWVDGAVSICYHLMSRASSGMFGGAIMQGTLHVE